MTDWNPVSVEAEINSIVNQIATGVSIASDAYKRFMEAEREYKRAYARAYMRHKGPAHEKRYQADLDAEVEAVNRDAADVAYRYAKDTNAALNSKLDAVRSIGVSVRQSYAVAGRGEF